MKKNSTTRRSFMLAAAGCSLGSIAATASDSVTDKADVHSNKNTVTIPSHDVPILARADVLVCGGGPAGIAAACSAARHGAEVLLVERWPSVGGMATNALVNIWHTSDRTKPVIRGLVQEAISRAGKSIHRLPGYPKRPETHEFEPEGMRIVFHDMLEQSGVRTLCNLAAVESIRDGDRLRGLLVDTKTGRKAILARIVIDTTGDGDIAANAGVNFDFGRSSDGLVQGMTMIFQLCGLDPKTIKSHAPDAERVFALMQKLRKEEKFPPFLDAAAQSYLRSPREPYVSYNMCPVAGNPLDEEELTRLSARARRQVMEYVKLWQKEMPGFQQARISTMGFGLGIRESRRIHGNKTLDAKMVVDAVKQPDAIGHGFWMLDIHDPKGSGHTTWVDQKPQTMPPVGDSYHIPLGMCLNPQIKNLAVAGRCASATHEGIASVRLQTHCMVMGQGVGTCAAMALHEGVDMAGVDVKQLQSTLRKDGVYLEEVPNSG